MGLAFVKPVVLGMLISFATETAAEAAAAVAATGSAGDAGADGTFGFLLSGLLLVTSTVELLINNHYQMQVCEAGEKKWRGGGLVERELGCGRWQAPVESKLSDRLNF